MTEAAAVSVCMATFNGAAHVVAQLESILRELGPNDEVVIVDDASSDDTVALIRAIGDARLRLTALDRNVGHVRAFELALGSASKGMLLLADQDDVWTAGRVDVFRSGLAHGHVVATNQDVLTDDAAPRPTVAPRQLAQTRLRGAAGVVSGLALGTVPYFGCTMGLSSAARDLALPFPRFVEAHDHWIALTGARLGGVYEVASTTLLRRLHGSNLTPTRRRGWRLVLATRARLLLSLVVLVVRPARRRLGP